MDRNEQARRRLNAIVAGYACGANPEAVKNVLLTLEDSYGVPRVESTLLELGFLERTIALAKSANNEARDARAGLPHFHLALDVFADKQMVKTAFVRAGLELVDARQQVLFQEDEQVDLSCGGWQTQSDLSHRRSPIVQV